MTIKGDLTVVGPLSWSGSYRNKKKDNQSSKCVDTVTVQGPAILQDVNADQIIVTGFLDAKNVSVTQSILVKGRCRIKNVKTPLLVIKNKSKKDIKLKNSQIEKVIIKCKKDVKVYVSDSSIVGRIEFTDKIGTVIVDSTSRCCQK